MWPGVCRVCSALVEKPVEVVLAVLQPGADRVVLEVAVDGWPTYALFDSHVVDAHEAGEVVSPVGLEED